MARTLTQKLQHYTGLKNTCPNCGTDFFRPKQYQKMIFCASCEHLLLPNINQPKKKYFLSVIWHSFSMTLCMMVVVMFVKQWQDNLPYSHWTIFLLALCILAYYFFKIATINALEKSFTATQDTLANMKDDNCEYISGLDSKQLTCPSCQSHRFVSLFNYKWVRKKTDTSIYKKLEHLNEKRHVGCLNCSTIYKLTNDLNAPLLQTENKTDSSHIRFVVFVVLICVFMMVYSENIANFLPLTHDDNERLVFFFCMMWANNVTFFANENKQPNSISSQELTRKLTKVSLP